MLIFSNCKINIGLYATEKRSDGYHNIESIFVPIPLQDVIDIVPSNTQDFELQILEKEIPGDYRDNICYKAWNLLKEHHDIGGVKMVLLKNIPLGAGLGGGSSNGAHTLIAINQLFQLNLNTSQLKEYASQLGSDCPFFIENRVQLAKGRGEILKNIPLALSNYYVVIINPGIHISTPQAYALISPQKPSFDLEKLPSTDIKNWKDLIHNQFEEPIALLYPEVSIIKRTLYDYGAIFASMSGSGSTVFGIFNKPIEFNTIFPAYYTKTLAL